MASDDFDDGERMLIGSLGGLALAGPLGAAVGAWVGHEWGED